MSASRRQLLRVGAAAAFAVASGGARAEKLRTAKVLCGFAPGGSSDIISRQIAAALVPQYADTALVENRTGAGGQLALAALKGAPPDGSVLAETRMSMLAIYPHIYKKLPYDPIVDLVPVAGASTADCGFAVGPAVPESVRTLSDYLAWVGKNPASGSFGSPATGSLPHFLGVLLGKSAGIQLIHVGYKGGQPTMIDLVAGHVPAACNPLGTFLPYVSAGKCRLLATSGRVRSRFTPDVPTFAEEGFDGLTATEWSGIFLPAGVSLRVRDRATQAVRAALTDPALTELLGRMGIEVISSTSEELSSILKADLERWAPLVSSVGFSVN